MNDKEKAAEELILAHIADPNYNLSALFGNVGSRYGMAAVNAAMNNLVKSGRARIEAAPPLGIRLVPNR